MSRFDPATANAKANTAYLNEVVKRYFGDDVQNNANIFATHGRFTMNILRPNDFTITYANFRRSQIPQIVDNLKMLAGK